jgi:outer membrane protein assembly factor BamB
VIAGDKVLFGSDDGYVYIIGITDGLKKWSFNCGAPVSSSPAITKDKFCILTEDGRLLAFGIK